MAKRVIETNIDILFNAIISLYRALPNGQENYSGENPKICKFKLSNMDGKRFNLKLEYIDLQAKTNFQGDSSGEGLLAGISSKEKIFVTRWEESLKQKFSNAYGVPLTLLEDTEKVLYSLGLENHI